MPYQTIVYEALSKRGVNVFAFENKDLLQTPFSKPYIEKVSYYYMNDYSKNGLLEKVKTLRPAILVVCGWNVKNYRYVARYYRTKTDIPVVCPIDTQYIGKLKQMVGCLTSSMYVKRLFTHIWVPGVRQYDFARRLGYDNQHIIMNSLTADTKLFLSAKIDELKSDIYPKRFLFVGRYSVVKGLDLLIDAWKSISNKKGWRVTLVGNGPLKEKLENQEGFDVLDFQDQSTLKMIAEKSGFFILPSIYEPWALVLQEFAAAGLPILCSDACGASPHFVVNGFNGFTFRNGDVKELAKKMERIIDLNDMQLLEYAHNSREISHYVTPEISAASLLGIM